MRRAVVDLLQPSPEPRVEFVQIGDAPLIEFAQEQVPDGPVPALQLPLARRRKWPAENQMNAQARTDSLQGVGAVRGAIVDHDAGGHATPKK
jgi:hypothetical protein